MIGGQVGGIIGGVLGGTETTAPTPPAPRPIQKVVHVGSHIKAPRPTYSVGPVYPPLAQEAHVQGMVVVAAVIDEHGNVVQARAVSGHPFLIDPALKAVLQGLAGSPSFKQEMFVSEVGFRASEGYKSGRVPPKRGPVNVLYEEPSYANSD